LAGAAAWAGAAAGTGAAALAGSVRFSVASIVTWAVSSNIASSAAAALERSIIRELDGLIRSVTVTVIWAPLSRLVTKTSCPIGRMAWAATGSSESSSWVAVPVSTKFIGFDWAKRAPASIMFNSDAIKPRFFILIHLAWVLPLSVPRQTRQALSLSSITWI
jgi:hypothetical protein